MSAKRKSGRRWRVFRTLPEIGDVRRDLYECRNAGARLSTATARRRGATRIFTW